MKVREYNEADENEVVALWQECGMIVPWNDPHQDIARKLKVDRKLFLVGVLDNKIIASVMGGYDGHRGWIYYLAVQPDFQLLGYGRSIMVEMETRLIARGCPKINLQVRAHNRKVIAFYKSLGYKESDLISMGKHLESDEPTFNNQ
jgi:ribosomal protein S18 acetylase RimI-like enzyme